MTETAAPDIDEARAELFALRMLDVLNDASLALLLSVGHQLVVGLAPGHVPAVALDELRHRRPPFLH